MSGVANPYAAPAARVEDIPANPQAEAIRRAHISHEASIKAVGFLYYLGAAVAIAGTAGFALAPDEQPALLALLFAALGLAQAFAGWGVRALRPWGRILGCVISALGLLAFPIGTLINAYILYLYLSKKGRTIFSAGYQEVIAATPDVRYRTSVIVWIFLALLVALALFAGFGIYLGR